MYGPSGGGDPNRIFAAWQAHYLAGRGRMPADRPTGWRRRLSYATSMLTLSAVVVGAAWLAAGTEVAIVAALCLAVLVVLAAVWIRGRRGYADELTSPANGGTLMDPSVAEPVVPSSDD